MYKIKFQNPFIQKKSYQIRKILQPNWPEPESDNLKYFNLGMRWPIK